MSAQTRRISCEPRSASLAAVISTKAISRWQGAKGLEYGHFAGLKRTVRAAARRAEGKGTPPIVIFGGSDFEAESWRRALGLGALGFTSEWPMLMGLIERTLGQSPEAH
jgi:hypothetical protein